MSYILSKDAAIYYEEYGSGEPLILLPGLLGTIESHWRRFLPEFSKHFHTIAVDIRGHGKTNNPSGKFRLGMLLEDLHAIFDTLQIEQAHICGYSLGGYIGLAYGLNHPGKIKSLVMHGTKYYWTPEAIKKTVEGFDVERILDKVPAWGEILQKDHAPGNGENGWRQLLDSSRAFIETMTNEGIPEARLNEIQFPVLVSVCDSDEMITQTETNHLAKSIPSARVQVIENCKHPFQSVPKQPFVEQCMDFFLSHAQTQTPIVKQD